MKSKTILTEESRKRFEELIGENLMPTLYEKCYQALQVAEQELEEKDKRLNYEKERCMYFQNVNRKYESSIIDVNILSGYKDKELESKDKEIAELNDMVIKSVSMQTDQLREIQALKEELDRLKEFEWKYKELAK